MVLLCDAGRAGIRMNDFDSFYYRLCFESRMCSYCCIGYPCFAIVLGSDGTVCSCFHLAACEFWTFHLLILILDMQMDSIPVVGLPRTCSSN